MTAGEPDTPPASFERIVPTAPARHTPAATAAPAATTGAQVSARAVLIGLVAVLALSVLLFVLLPRLLNSSSPPATTTVPEPVAEPAAASAAAPAPPARAAWDDPAMLEARAAAQALQQQFQDESARLRERGVERWAADRYTPAIRAAEQAAAAFTAKDFITARSGYEAAVALTGALLGELPQRLADALQTGATALDSGDKAKAQAAFELALALEPGNAAATRGLQRVGTLDAVQVKLETARRLEQGGDDSAALAAYRAALALDPDTLPATQAIARIENARTDTEFRRLLGEAIAALDRGDAGLAESRLARARALRGDDPGLRQASARLAELQRGSRLALLQQAAATQVAAEDWSGAVETFKQALAIDPAIGFARENLARAESRAALAAQLRGYIERPARLSSAAVAAEAQQALARAEAERDGGPRLSQQIDALRTALAQAAQPVTVTLRSDNQTEVTIYKVGAQGRFATRELSLKPGRYVAVGSRAGYRDVRREFDVAAGADAAVEIACQEKL